ncbi:MAG: hypothetical protein GYB68_12700 [Chloroflexi bacterium]|nr:hypothetical protein [Chloroflexota bacterium]
MSSYRVFRAHSDRIEALDIQATSLDDATLQTGHGVYAVLRIYPGPKALRVSAQLDRMRSSAALLDQPFPLSNQQMQTWMRQALAQVEFPTPRLRVTVLHDEPDTAIITVEDYQPPSVHLYEDGVRVQLVETAREAARAKDSRFIETRQTFQRPSDVYESILVNHAGYLLEGSSSNVYAVLDGQLRTADEGVLAGIARGILLEAAPAVLPLRLEPIHRDDLPGLEAAMLSSTSRGLVPIVQIDEQQIGDGRPAAIYRQLAAAYQAAFEAQLELL